MPFTKISVLIPTRGRVAWLDELFNSFDVTVGNPDNAELVFRVDNDDAATAAFLEDRDCIIVTGPRFEGYKSLPRFFNELHKAAHGDILMCGNDDMVFRTPDWPARIIEVANRYPDGLFNIGVSTHNESHYPFSIVSKQNADTMGFIWDPRIFWGDIFLRDVMAYFGRTIMLSTVEIEHKWAGYRPDQVFRESDKDIVSIDPMYWSVTHKRAVDAAIQRLMGVTA